jgi:hypothetical protein
MAERIDTDAMRDWADEMNRPYYGKRVHALCDEIDRLRAIVDPQFTEVCAPIIEDGNA